MIMEQIGAGAVGCEELWSQSWSKVLRKESSVAGAALNLSLLQTPGCRNILALPEVTFGRSQNLFSGFLFLNFV